MTKKKKELTQGQRIELLENHVNVLKTEIKHLSCQVNGGHNDEFTSIKKRGYMRDVTFLFGLPAIPCRREIRDYIFTCRKCGHERVVENACLTKQDKKIIKKTLF